MDKGLFRFIGKDGSLGFRFNNTYYIDYKRGQDGEITIYAEETNWNEEKQRIEFSGNVKLCVYLSLKSFYENWRAV